MAEGCSDGNPLPKSEILCIVVRKDLAAKGLRRGFGQTASGR